MSSERLSRWNRVCEWVMEQSNLIHANDTSGTEESEEMAADDGAVKQKKHRTESEEKKRKHGEVEAAEPIASKKKSRLGSESASQPSLNGKAVQHDTDSSMIGEYQNLVISNGSHPQTVNGSAAASLASQNNNDKPKHSQMDEHQNGEPFLNQESSQLPSASKKKSKKKSKSHGKTDDVGNQVNDTLPSPVGNNDTIAMDIDIDTQEPQPSNYASETPYIQRSIHDILAGAPAGPPEGDEASPFFQQSISFYVPLSPIGLTTPLESACAEHLSSLCLKYYPPLHAVILCYAEPHFRQEEGGSTDNPTSQALAISTAEYAAPMVWLEAKLLLFKPIRGHKVEGVIVLQNESRIGLQVFNLFSGRISRANLPSNWRWNQPAKSNKQRSRKGVLKGGNNESQDPQQMDVDTHVVHDDVGHWVDGKGKKVGGVLEFWVWDVEMSMGVREAERSLPTIEGTLREELLREDDEYASTSRQAIKKGKKRA